jgi:hypothetical protein
MRASAADALLLAELELLGLLASARQLERWRQYGIVETERRSLGRGRGSRSRYRSGSAALLAELIRELSKQRQLDAAVLTLFERGQPVPEAAVKRAYRNSFVRLREKACRSDETTDAAALRIERGLLRTVQGRAWSRQLRRAGYDDGAFRRFIAVALRLALDGRRPDPADLLLVAEAAGFAPLARALATAAPAEGGGPVAHLLDLFDLGRLETRTAHATLEELQDAVAAAHDVFALVAPAVAIFGGVTGFKDAGCLFGADVASVRAAIAPTMLVLAEIEDLPQARAQAQEWQPGFDALAAILGALPFWYGRLFGPSGTDELDLLAPDRRDYVLGRVRDVVAAMPEVAKLVPASE